MPYAAESTGIFHLESKPALAWSIWLQWYNWYLDLLLSQMLLLLIRLIICNSLKFSCYRTYVKESGDAYSILVSRISDIRANGKCLAPLTKRS